MESAKDANISAVLERFKLTQFRAGQREVIETVLAGRDCLCVMPTGGGKSLCYQIPALCLPGVTLVVSPLIALMTDQENQLKALGLPVASIHGGQEPAEQSDRLRRLANGEYKLFYVSPERLRSHRFLDLFKTLRVSLLAIDEAHCISEWGHDFRPDYSRLGWFRQQLGMPTALALTATATDIVRRDVSLQLKLRDPAVFLRGFDRPNLYYRVTQAHSKQSKHNRLEQICDEEPGPIIIYAASRKACEEVAAFVRSTCKRGTSLYHAGLPSSERTNAQDSFMQGKTDVMVATNAFGMGVDKRDVRAVIHYSIPGTLEAYYQEAGRAGRDGKPSHCEILFSFADRYVQEYFIDSEYPEKLFLKQLLELLRSQGDDLIELTRAELAERMGKGANEFTIGSALKILESSGAIERLDFRKNLATFRLFDEGPDLADLLPSTAHRQKKVMRYLQRMVGDRLGQDCLFSPDQTAQALETDRASLLHAISDISSRVRLEYIPPFRGSATRLIDRLTPFEKLPIDFETLESRKSAEHDKLSAVFGYCQAADCRRNTLLRYFGDEAGTCNNCDICNPTIASSRPKGQRKGTSGTAPTRATPQALAERSANARKLLEALGELHGRFGKSTVALAVTGSQSSKVTRFGLQKRTCFGSLASLKQTEVIELLERMMAAGLVEQGGDRLRPTVGLSDLGRLVMRGDKPWPALAS